MLIITRKKDQCITIKVGEEEIDIVIANIWKGHVSIGIEANKEKVLIKRQELEWFPSSGRSTTE